MRIVKDDDSFQHQPGRVGWAGNGGFHMLNLVAQMRPRTILLVGFDMRVDRGVHWHGQHPAGMNNPTARNVERWRRCTDAAAPAIAALGVAVRNCTPGSALTAYPFMSFEEALATC